VDVVIATGPEALLRCRADMAPASISAAVSSTTRVGATAPDWSRCFSGSSHPLLIILRYATCTLLASHNRRRAMQVGKIWLADDGKNA
jgi:hypothetical protein